MRVSLLFGLFIASVGYSQTLVVLDKGTVVPSDRSLPAELAVDRAGRSLFGRVRAEPAQPQHPLSLSLIHPPEWGKTIAEATSGKVEHESAYPGAFRGRIALSGLEPNHAYILTLNGRPDLPGNELLPDAVPGLPDERYFDFLPILSNAEGTFRSEVAVRLPAGQYRVRLYVKDRADFKIVLYRDYFPFTVLAE